MLKRTAFYDIHSAIGAKLIDFGGFEMPVQYAGILKEHQAVRERAGIFDVSHMGEIMVRGPKALDLIQFATVNDASKLTPGKIQYSAMCYEDGGIVDDLLVYCITLDEYLLVVNASNKEKDLAWITSLNEKIGAELEDISEQTCLLAVQGPKSIEILQKLTQINLSEITYYTFEIGEFAGFEDVILSATGYTGEKGFEIYFDSRKVDPAVIWNSIMSAGSGFGLEPAGLGARDTLRLEMGFALYGNDISSQTTTLEAGLGWITKLDKGNFCGREALLSQKDSGVTKRLVGFKTDDRRAIPRSHYILKDDSGNEIGEVTSGGQSPNLGIGIGMGYVISEFAKIDTKINVEIRGKAFPAIVTKPPFIKN
ncbi:MAG TPA: glycine cleavage system aminomethyltransferase GcvT [Bacteroidetes bacterium]|nr:glycine cleavage system aminomethyltransferase GcvT [Bacteroidota bacterium]